jgi:hypothetical protein
MDGWSEMADVVLDVLECIALNRRRIAAAVARRGITLQQLTAVAVVESIRDWVELEISRRAGPLRATRRRRQRQ